VFLLIKWRRRVKPKTDGKNEGGGALLICHIWSTKKKRKGKTFAHFSIFSLYPKVFAKRFLLPKLYFFFFCGVKSQKWNWP